MNNQYTFPVLVVRLILVDQQGKILLLKRAKSGYGGGCWCLPGGKVDYGETVEDTVRKELFEETSLGCDSAKFLFYQDSLPETDRGMHCFNLYFECTWNGMVKLNEESTDYAWIERQDMDKYQIAFKNDLALKEYWGVKG
jgi:ADP-ribose pyrophosphatase YjhB (NUDIX family)